MIRRFRTRQNWFEVVAGGGDSRNVREPGRKILEGILSTQLSSTVIF
jgi:hypothetical protein